MDEQTRQAARLWALAQPAVSAFVLSLARDFQYRDDVLQETAVAVLESFHRYNPEQSFVGWAIGIARNQVRLHFRRLGRERLVFDSEAIDALSHAFSQEPESDRRLDYLADCFSELDQKSRELCRLRYECDRKPAAMGELLGMGANAVAKALQRVRQKLRDCIEGKARVAGVLHE